MKIIITGAKGFVGTNLTSYLIQNQIDAKPLSLRNGNWKSEIDLEANAIIHLAGKAHDTKKTAEADAYFKINTKLTAELFDVFLTSPIQDFFYFSSVKAVADKVINVLDEEAMPNPKTPYGQSKLQAEQYILSKQLPKGKRVFIIRPCMVHGPGNKGNLNLLYALVNKGIPYPLAAFRNERSFLSIDNLNYLVYSILSSNIMSGIYNFADDTFVSTNDLVKITGAVSHKKAQLVKVPKVVINIMANIGNILRLPLNTESVKKLTEDYRVSNQKIKVALGIQSLPVTAEQGLEKTIKSFMK
jgi:nucleoside-diphosphate-sugar epimerase